MSTGTQTNVEALLSAVAILPAADGTPTGAPGQAAQVPDWIMIARAGLWRGHPSMGTELVTPAHLQSALDYFRRHYAAHGADLVVDYHHASIVAPLDGVRAPAAGWIRDMELRNDGAELWGRALWTAEAANAIAHRQYRYLSPVLRFSAPDRVTGQPVPLQVHSVALTNTPFLTELEGLNQAAGTAGGASLQAPTQGGQRMTLIEMLAQALDKKPEQVASELGLSATGDKDVANSIAAFVSNANALRESLQRAEARAAGTAPALPEYVCNALGVAAGSDETAVKAAILKLRAPRAELAAVRAQLGLAADAPEAEVANAIGCCFMVKIDESDRTPGFKFNEWEMKGVPLRIEIGMRDI
jgi:phage I-like protein